MIHKGRNGIVVRRGGTVAGYTVMQISAGSVALQGRAGTLIVSPHLTRSTVPAGLTAADLPVLPRLLPPELRPSGRFETPAGPYGMSIYRFSPSCADDLDVGTRPVILVLTHGPLPSSRMNCCATSARTV